MDLLLNLLISLLMHFLSLGFTAVTIDLGVCSLGAVICDAFLVDIIGRRRMTLIGFTGACFGVTLMAIIGCLHYEQPGLGSALMAIIGCLHYEQPGLGSALVIHVAQSFDHKYRVLTSTQPILGLRRSSGQLLQYLPKQYFLCLLDRNARATIQAQSHVIVNLR